MDTPQISRSGRVLKKSAKVKEMEDFDINELDVQGKSRKKPRLTDEYEEFDDKRVAPIKIPKISLGMQGGSKKKVDVISVGKPVSKPSFHPGAMKAKQDPRHSIYHDSSDASKESDSSSVSSESSSSSASSSEPSDDEEQYTDFRGEPKRSLVLPQLSQVHHERVIVEQNQQRFESPIYMEPSSEPSSDESEDPGSDPALVIAEDSEDGSLNYPPGSLKGGMKKRGGKTDPAFAPRQGGPGGRKRPVKAIGTPAAKRKKPVTKGKPLTAYMLWCTENRKKIAAAAGNIGFANIRKKMGETWQALPEKEKMAWRRKAKMLVVKESGNVINTGSSSAQTKSINRNAAGISDELMKGSNLNEPAGTLGTAPIDSAAHLKLLGDSLTVIGQRLIEHEGQLAVSGIYSVLLDTLLCAVGPLLCLTTQIAGLENLPQDVFQKTLDHIAYFMPGL